MAADLQTESAQSGEGPELAAALRRAVADLERRVRAGQSQSCESTLAEHPALAANKDARLELIYTEFVLRQELNAEPAPEEWAERFPQWQDEIRELFEVHSYVEESAAAPPAGEPGLDSWWFAGEQSPPQAGQRLGNYELLEELGRGGMGTVYRARQSPLQRQVALKTVHLSGHPESLSRFRLEAEASARLAHPNIVQIFEVGADDERPYFTMEYVAGGSLAAVIRQRPLAARTTASLLAPLARAVHYAHERGIVHRDIKPANLLLAASERAEAVPLPGYAVGHEAGAGRFELKITDFGLAKCVDLGPTQTLSGQTLGTPSYMAPEQAARGASAAGPACDVYALGAVLYDMLVGRPPFNAATVGETLQRLQHDDPVSIRSLQPNVPRDLETICLKCLHKDPLRRYASAAELADDLERFLNGQPVVARSISIAERGVKWTKRHPALAALLASLALGSVGIGWEWYRAEGHRARAEQQASIAQQAQLAERKEHERVERTLYSHDVSLANLEYLSNNTTRAAQLLAACPADQRHWEWKYLERVFQQQQWDFSGFAQPVRSVALSQDGRFVAAASATWGIDQPAEIRIWETAGGKLLHTLQKHPSSVMDVEFDPTGRRLVSAGVIWHKRAEGGVIVWDVTTGEKVWSQDKVNSHAATYSPDGRTIAIGHTDGRITLHDAETGRLLKTTARQRGVIFDLAFRPDRQYLASACRDGTFQIWDVATSDPVVVPGLGDVRRVSYSPDGKLLAVATFGAAIRLYEQEGRQLTETHTFHVGERIGAMRFSPDGQYLIVTALDEGIKFLDAQSGQVRRELHGHNGAAMDVSQAADGRALATCGLDGTVKVWDLTRQANSRRRIISGPFFAGIAFGPKGRLAALATSYNTSGIRDPQQPALKLWDLERGEFSRVLSGHTGWLTSVAADPESGRLLTGSEDKTAILWDARWQARQHTLAGHTAAVRDVAFLSRGNLAATAAADGEIRLWNPADGSQRGQWKHPQGVAANLAGHPTLGILAAATGGDIHLLGADLRPKRHLTGASGIRQLAFSSDGAWLAAAREDTTIDLWRTSEALEKSAAPPATLTGHTDAVTSVCFSPDGLRLASASADRTVKLWDVQSRQEVMSLPGAGLSGLHAKIAFTPDGAALVLIDQTAIDSWDVSAADTSPEAQQQRLRQWHAAEMTQAAGGGHWFAAAQHGEQLSQLAPASAEYAAQHGIALARLGQWDEASAHLQEALNREPAAETCYHLALVQLRQGDEAGYGKTAAAYLAAHAQSESATVTNDMVWTCALSPAPIREHPEIVALAEKAAATLKSAASLNTLGGVYLRAGRPKDAIKQISEGIRRRGAGLPQDWILLCLAYAAQGDRDRAASELKRTKEWLAEQEARRTAHRPTDPMNTWHARLELEMLLREAEAAVNDQSEA